jgi:hypothetical protein
VVDRIELYNGYNIHAFESSPGKFTPEIRKVDGSPIQKAAARIRRGCHLSNRICDRACHREYHDNSAQHGRPNPVRCQSSDNSSEQGANSHYDRRRPDHLVREQEKNCGSAIRAQRDSLFQGVQPGESKCQGVCYVPKADTSGLAAIKRERPDLYSAFNPWDRITDVKSVRRLLRDGGISDAEVVVENGFQLRSAEDWWIIALGSGLRWVIDQMGQQVAARVKADNVNWLSENKIDRLEINAIYAIGSKSS